MLSRHFGYKYNFQSVYFVTLWKECRSEDDIDAENVYIKNIEYAEDR